MSKKSSKNDKKKVPPSRDKASGAPKTALTLTRAGMQLEEWGLRFLLWGTLLFVTITRIRLLDMPLERDEGGFAYIGRHLFSDPQLYNGLYDNKLPGLYALYALFVNVLGYSPTGIHLGLLFCNLLSCWLLYRWISDRFEPRIGVGATCLFALMSVTPNVLGFAAHATQLLLPFVFGGFLLIEKGIKTGRWPWFLWGGLALGAAILVKQSAAVFSVFAGLDLLLRRGYEKTPLRWVVREAALLTAGVFVPFAGVAAYFMSQHRFDDLWLWTVDLPATSSTGNWQYLKFYYDHVIVYVFKKFEVVWGAAVLGLVALWFVKLRWTERVAIVLFCLLACGSVFLGLAFYPHYFVLALPAVALAAAMLLEFLRSKTGVIVYWTGLLLLLLLPVFRLQYYFFSPNLVSIQRTVYGLNFFSELRKIGEELSRRTGKDQKIGVMGSEPELLVYARRESATGHLFMYPIIKDNPKVVPFRQQYLDDLQKNQPEYIVFNSLSTSWTRGYEGSEFFNRIKQYVEANYEVVGKAEVPNDGRPGVVVWDRAAAEYQFKGPNRVLVYRRRATTQ